MHRLHVQRFDNPDVDPRTDCSSAKPGPVQATPERGDDVPGLLAEWTQFASKLDALLDDIHDAKRPVRRSQQAPRTKPESAGNVRRAS
jgi:hypothetical protein